MESGGRIGVVSQAIVEGRSPERRLCEADVVINGVERHVTVSSWESGQGEMTIVRAIDFFAQVRGGVDSLASVMGNPGRAIRRVYNASLEEADQS